MFLCLVVIGISALIAFALSDVENEVDLILSRASIFSTPVNITELVICPAHRGALGIGWRRSANERCRIPVILSRHSDEVLKKPRAERGLSKVDSQLVLRESGIFLPVGSGEIETYCFNINTKLSSIAAFRDAIHLQIYYPFLFSRGVPKMQKNALYYET